MVTECPGRDGLLATDRKKAAAWLLENANRLGTEDAVAAADALSGATLGPHIKPTNRLHSTS